MAGPRPAAPAIARGYPASQPPDQFLPGPGVEESQLPDLPLYERLIGDGIAAADARGSCCPALKMPMKAALARPMWG
jgi:hypothetical protein